jgi:DHA1 family bicyclomycin/chloramphenicol resistance-like MFS transporter
MDRKLRLWVICAGLIVAIGPLSIDMYLPSFPALQAYFAADAAAVQATLSSFFIGLAIGQLIYGPLTDRYGRRRPLLFGLSLYIVASLGCALAPDIVGLAGLRFLQALGGSAGMVVTRAMVRDRFAPQDMARILSAMTAVMGIAPILAPTLGGVLFETVGWQGIFVVLAVFGASCLTVSARMLPETLRERSMRGVGGAVRIYFELLGDRRFMAYALPGGMASGAMFAYISVAAFVFVDVYRFTPVQFSWLFGCNAAALICASQLNAIVLRSVPAASVLRAAMTVSALASVVMLVMAVSGVGGAPAVIAPLFVAIGSLGFSSPNSTALAMAPFADRAGIASALIGTLQFAIAAISGALAGHLQAHSAIAMAAVMTGCGLIAVLLLRLLAPQARAPAL